MTILCYTIKKVCFIAHPNVPDELVTTDVQFYVFGKLG